MKMFIRFFLLAAVLALAAAACGETPAAPANAAAGDIITFGRYEQDYAAAYGSFYDGCSVDDGTVAVRPAFRLDLESDLF